MKTFCLPCYKYRRLKKLLLVMKLTTFLILIGFLQVNAAAFGQHVNFTAKNISIETLIKELKKQTGYSILYDAETLKGLPKINVKVTNETVGQVLDEYLKSESLEYMIIEKNIVIKRIAKETTAQNAALLFTGKVLDEKKMPMSGVDVTVKNQQTGQTITNNKGEFSILVTDPSSILQFSFIGYQTVELPIKDLENPLLITMKISTSNLDQVQITAYGTTTKRFNAGDITTITAGEIAENPVQNVLEAIQGHVPGLSIIQNTGQAGGAFTTRIRNSVNFQPQTIAQQSYLPQPLIVIDGVSYPGGTLPLATDQYGQPSFLQGGSGLNYLNPNNIQSVDVLKDADATAIYGARGAYGVILITTKKARAGAPSLNVNFYSGVSVKGTEPKLLNTDQYLMIRREAIANNNSTISSTDYDLNGTWPANRYTNWINQFEGAAGVSNNADLSYSGGSELSSFIIGGHFDNQGNIQRHKGSVDDASINFSLSTRTSDNKLSISLTGSYLSSGNDEVPVVLNQDGPATAPNAPPLFLPDGSLNWGTGSNIASSINNIYQNRVNNLLASTTLTYKPVKNLTFNVVMGYNDLTTKETAAAPTTAFAPGTAGVGQYTSSVFGFSETRSITVSPYADYHFKLGKKGDLDLKTGGELDDRIITQDQITGVGFSSDALLYDPAAATSVGVAYNSTPTRSMGFYGIAKYIYDDKYIIDVNGRRDGSSKFGPDNQFGNFGSIAGAWLFSEEKLIKDNLPFINYGKLRASTGVVGGDAVPAYYYLNYYSTLGSSTYAGNTGIGTYDLSNPYLQWEKDKRTDIAIEMGFFNNRIYAEADHYNNLSSNLLGFQPLSTVTGFTGITQNTAAVIRTYGWELTLNTTNIKSSDFLWTTRINATIPHSDLVSIPTSELGVLNPGYIVGKPVTGVMLYKYAGVNPQTGNYNFTNAAGVTNEHYFDLNQKSDRTQFLDLAPKFTGGMTNSFKYKQLGLDFFFMFAKQEGKTYLASQTVPAGFIGYNPPVQELARWQKPGDITNIPKPTTSIFALFAQKNFQQSTGAYGDASYARLQNVNLTYTFDTAFLNKMNVRGLQVYLRGQNLLTISKFGGLDPENLNVTALPIQRTFVAGFNLTL
jgi:TonB-linked SusC/RagA family outer membrane protein